MGLLLLNSERPLSLDIYTRLIFLEGEEQTYKNPLKDLYFISDLFIRSGIDNREVLWCTSIVNTGILHGTTCTLVTRYLILLQ